MRTGVVFVLTAVLVCPQAWAADYEVPVSGTLAKAIAAANANTDGDTYEIEIAGSSADSGTVRKSASITGDSTARLSGSLTFTGTGVKSALDNLSFTAGSGTAVTNGTLGFGEAQDLTVNNVSFSQRTGGYYGGAFANLGGAEINGSSFTGNRGNLGGALFAEGKLTLDTSEGNILFSGNTATNINEGGADVYLNNKETAVVIEGDANTLSMDGGFAGVGSIDKNGANTLIFDQNADNRLFVGDFTQTAGTTLVYADNFFGGKNTVAEGSVLHFAGNAAVNNLRLQTGGRLDLRRPGPFAANTVTITNLISDGSAVVVLQTDGTDADLLKITGSADGMITIDVRAAGSNPTKKEIEVVNTEEASGNAEFKLAGGKVDIGAHEYGLTHG